MIKKNSLYYALLLILILSAIFTKDYFLFMPGYYFKKLFIYLLFLTLIIQFSTNKIKAIDYDPMSLLLFSLLLVTQSITLFYTINIPDQNIAKLFISLLVFSFILFLHYYVLRNFFHILQEKFINYFFKVFYIALTIILLVNILQFFSIIYPTIFHGIEQFIADNLVLQWYRPDPDDKRFYTIANSYVQTNHRLNGLVEETSENVAILFLVFIPFLLGKISTSLKKKKAILFYMKELIFFILIFIVFVLSKSSSGLIFAAISAMLFFYIFLRYCTLGTNIFIFSISLLLLITLITTNYDTIAHYWFKLFNDKSISTLSRAGVTVGLSSMALDNLFFGVGKGMVSTYLIPYIPNWSYNYEIDYWIENKGFPALSMFFWLISEYGLPILFLLLYLIIQTWKGLKYLSTSSYNYLIVFVSYQYFLIAFLIALQTQTMIYKSMIILPFTFYIVIGLHGQALMQRRKFL